MQKKTAREGGQIMKNKQNKYFVLNKEYAKRINLLVLNRLTARV